MPRQHVPTAIVGPNPLLRESLSRFLQWSRFDVIGLASCLDELVPGALPRDRTALVITDTCDHPGEACEQLERFGRDHPLARLVVLANHCASGDIVRVLNAGATGYFATIATRDDFINSLELVMGGQIILPSEGLSSVLVGEAAGAHDASAQPDSMPIEAPAPSGVVDVPQFSPRELYILRCLIDGSSNKAIAREYDIAEGTVKVHVKAILRKIKVKNRTQAAIWALNNRALVWPSAASPCGEAAEGQPNINTTLASQTVDTTPPAPISDQDEQDTQGKTHEIRCVAGTDVTPQAG